MFNFDISIIMWSAIVFITLFLIHIINSARVIAMIKGQKIITIILVFFEAAISLSVSITVISNAIQNGINFFIISFYSLGVAMGVFLGMIISKKIAKNLLSVNIVTKQLGTIIEDLLRTSYFGVTCYQGSGKDGNLKVLNVICRAVDFVALKTIVSGIDEKAMLTSHSIEGLHGGFIFNRGYK
jgi:uncharacterized protein YebE (UPF0316 family)